MASLFLPTHITQSYTRQIVITSSLFDDPEADVVLQSADGVDFHIDLTILAVASPVFKDMSTLPLPASENTKDGQNVITMQESCMTLELLLQLVHPAMYPPLHDATLGDFRDVLMAADKYQMPKIAPALEPALGDQRFFKEHASAFRVFALANRSGMRTLARAAARTLLAFPPLNELPAALPELETVPATAYHKLLKYRGDCFAVLFPPIDSVSDYRSWVGTWWNFQVRNRDWSTVRWLLRGKVSVATWATCSSCKVKETATVTLASWFIDYVERMRAAYYKNVAAQTLLSAELLEPTVQFLIESDSQCACKTRAPRQLSEFSRILAAGVEKQLAEIVYDP